MQIRVSMLRSAVAIAALAFAGSALAAGQEGQTVAKDQRTGKLRNATAAEVQKLNELRKAEREVQKAARAASGAPVAGVASLQQNGVLAAHVDEESMMHTVVRRTADGKLEAECAHGSHAAHSALSTPVSTHAKEHQNEVE